MFTTRLRPKGAAFTLVPRVQRGQAAVLLVGLIVVACMAFFFMARAGTAAAERMKANSLADTAAYSSAVWVARTLNYNAYANRAIVANEVMIAQAVTMSAWTHYVGDLMEEIANDLEFASLVWPALATVSEMMQEAAEYARTWVDYGVKIEVPVRSAYTRYLNASQMAMLGAAGAFGLQAVADEVVWSVDQRWHAVVLPTTWVDLAQFTELRTGSERAPLADLVQRSLDAFSRDRATERRFPFPPSCGPNQFEHFYAQLVRRGGTRLNADFSAWSAADTLSLHTWKRGSGFFGRLTCHRRNEGWAIAAGGADTSEAHSPFDREAYALRDNPRAAEVADESVEMFKGYMGLAPYRELREDGIADDPTLRLSVLVRAPLQGSDTGRQSGPSGRLALTSPPSQRYLTGHALGEVYFERPEGWAPTGAEFEYPTLMSPHWHARLVLPTTAERALAAARALIGGGK